MHNKKNNLRDRYIRMVVIEQNDDENTAMNLVKEFLKTSLELFKPKAETMIRQEIENKSRVLNRYSIIQKLDEDILMANEDWLMNYVLHAPDLIISSFNQYWDEINSTMHQQLRSIINDHLTLFIEFYQVTEQMNAVLKTRSNHSLTFIDDLLKLPNEDTDGNFPEKKNGMSKLLFQYFTNEKSDTTKIIAKSGADYTVDPLWNKIAGDLREASMELKALFLTISVTYILYLKG